MRDETLWGELFFVLMRILQQAELTIYDGDITDNHQI